MGEYEGMRRVQYGDAIFVPVCGTCGRFVKADKTMQFRMTPGNWNDGMEPVTPNADCKRCGRTSMVWEGYL